MFDWNVGEKRLTDMRSKKVAMPIVNSQTAAAFCYVWPDNLEIIATLINDYY